MMGPQFEWGSPSPADSRVCRACYRFWANGEMRIDPLCAICKDNPDLRSYFVQITQTEYEGLSQSFVPEK